jgi:GntR family transcriptional repressor for pyruvate dehydrogenase complex
MPPSALPQPFPTIQRNQSLSDKVTEHLTEAILTRALVPGQRLPSERELGEQFNVSRTVIREAVRSLAARGLVSVTSGRGVEVASPDANQVAQSMRLIVRGYKDLDYGKVHEARTALETQTAELAAKRAKPGQVEHLRSLWKKHQTALHAGDLDAASELDFLFHRELAVMADNEILLGMLDSIADVLHEVRDRAIHEPAVTELGLTAHSWILECVAAGDPAAARGAMQKHLLEAERAWRAGLIEPTPEVGASKKQSRRKTAR